VDCPICGRTVPESEINLHLDLQCPGQEGPSQPLKTPASSRSSPDVVALPHDTPTGKPSTSRRVSGSGKGGVAAIFGGPVHATSLKRKVKAEEDLGDKGGKEEAIAGQKSETLSSQTKGQMNGEKKPRINPLVANQPLAERSRPSSLAGYVGQLDLVGPGSLLRSRIEAGHGVGSCILWGPPGSGKTQVLPHQPTLARLIAKTADADFKELSATSAGTADVRQVFEQAKNSLKLTGRRTILMIDEIHRFNKSQQDLFLPYVENGWVQLIGATTENPSFKVNGALLSRCQVFTLAPHTPESLEKILSNALASLPPPVPHLPPDLLPFLADVADGDARQALNGLELALKVCEAPRQTRLDEEPEDQAKRDKELMDAVRRGLRKGYDRSGEERYDMISALHKCLRGSDGSAAMYWLARMITGGEDPLYIARRLVVVASEDVGLADNHALPLAMATYQACQVIGLPECRINLAHCVAYLAEAPKSTRAYTAYNRAESLATTPPLPGVPLQIRNAPTRLMKQLGYGKEYAYNPDYAHPVVNEYLPRELIHRSSLAVDTPDEHILKRPDMELRGKIWDEGRLDEFEKQVLKGQKWDGRDHHV
ncbi:hypothetical protein BCR39DRAFT_471453, partial [Naematelia encephala]